MSQRATIVQAAANALAAASGTEKFSGTTFCVRRQYVPEAKLPDLEQLTLTLPPIGPEKRTLITRSLIEKDFSFDVLIQQLLTQACEFQSPQGNPELDALLLFAEQAAHFFEPDPELNQDGKIAGTTASWMETQIDPPYDFHMLRELRLFTSRVIVTVRYY